MRTCFTGARVIDPSRQLDRQLDLLVAEGNVVALGENLPQDGARVIDLSGKIIVPGLIDLHVHLREPGDESKETVFSGLSALRPEALLPWPACPTPLRLRTGQRWWSKF